MGTDHKALCFSLAIVMIFGLFLGARQAAAYDKFGDARGESTGGNHDQWIDVDEWPNPMERRTGASAPAMRPGAQLTPVEKAGLSEPAMRPAAKPSSGRANSVPGIPGATPGDPEVIDLGEQR